MVVIVVFLANSLFNWFPPLSLIALTPTVLASPLKVETIITNPNDDLGSEWSFDGTKVAFVGHFEGKPKVYVYNTISHTTLNLSNSPNNDFHPIWSPDSNYVAFFDRPWTDNSRLQLRVANVRTAKTVQTSKAYDDISDVTWWPDSSRLSFKMANGFYVFDIASEQTQEIYHNPSAGYLYTATAPNARYAALLATYNDYNHPADFLLCDLNSHVTTPINIVDVVNTYNERFVVWSHDTSKFAFRSSTPANTRRLYIYDVPTKIATLIFETKPSESIELGGWSQDDQLAWAVGEPPTSSWNVTVYTSRGDNLPPRSLLTIAVASIADLHWSPTRNQLAFHTYAGIYVANTETGDYRDFIQGLGRVLDYNWSSSGNHIAAHLDGVGEPPHQDEIAVVDIRNGSVYVYGNGTNDLHIAEARVPEWIPNTDSLTISIYKVWGNAGIAVMSFP